MVCSGYMPRAPRIDVGNHIYHIINRANARLQIFHTKKDYQAFESIIEEAQERANMRILSYCIMPNHWHFVLNPRKDGDLSRFIGWLTLTHATRYHAFREQVGYGHLYQGRYKSFLVQKEECFLQLCRYVEQNPLRAKLVKKAQNWQWSSLWRREYGNEEQRKILALWPTLVPHNYIRWVNTLPSEEAAAISLSMQRGCPLGAKSWVGKMVSKFGLESTIRQRGRPRKGS